MEFTGKLRNVSRDWNTGEINITFTVNEPSAVNGVNDIKDCEKLTITAKKYRKKRSLNANNLLWVCLGQIATSTTPPLNVWKVYLQMLKRYGKFTYICVKPNVVEAVKAQWRECEEVGEIQINGQTAVQLLCYFGSSTYDTKEFSVLLDGVISEMKEMGLETPTSEEMRMAIEQWERMQGNAVNNTNK